MVTETPLVYVLKNYLHWPFIVAAAWWLRGKINESQSKLDEIHSNATNHIPTLLTSIDKNIAILVDRKP